MSKQVTIKGYVYEVNLGIREATYCIFQGDNMADKWHTLVGPVEFTYSIPEDFNPVAAKIAAAEAERDRIGQEYAAKVRELNERIAKLQAIENGAEVAA